MLENIKRIFQRSVDVVAGIGFFAACGVLVALTASVGIAGGLIIWVMRNPLTLGKCFLAVMLGVLAGRLGGIW